MSRHVRALLVVPAAAIAVAALYLSVLHLSLPFWSILVLLHGGPIVLYGWLVWKRRAEHHRWTVTALLLADCGAGPIAAERGVDPAALGIGLAVVCLAWVIFWASPPVEAGRRDAGTNLAAAVILGAAALAGFRAVVNLDGAPAHAVPLGIAALLAIACIRWLIAPARRA